MSEDKSEATTDARLKEIQASILEGKMMLQVLRALPASENNNAFISRFEDLVSRLENYKIAASRIQASDVQSQLDALREKQESIRKLLSRTAVDFQAALSPSVQLPGSSQQTSDQPSNSPADLLTYFSSLVSNGTGVPNSQEATEQLHKKLTSQPAEVATDAHSTTQTTANTATISTDEVPDSVTETSISANSQIKWASLFAIQMEKLNALTDDSKRFENMVERLQDITRRAHLTEASQFLGDIVVRFHDLQRSFSSLRDSYESIRNDSQQTDETRAEQFSSFHEFLAKLEQNLETTKECFFTVYHLVKANIEQNMADGTLCEDPEDEPEEVEQPRAAAADASTEPSTRPANSPTSEDALEAQKAHLAALQNQTLTEREEIGRLLKQRDELAERLRTLRAAALAASQVDVDAAEDTVENRDLPGESEPFNAPAPSGDDKADSVVSSSELDPVLFARLEAKRQELAQLKAHLALLRRAEQQVNSLATTNLPVSDNEVVEVDRSERSHRPSPSPIPAVVQTSLNDNAGSKQQTPTPVVPPVGDALSFQNPNSLALKGNTDRLYEDMREARIRMEAQRTKVPGLLNTFKQHTPTAASGTTSQDRTTLATWGGSSIRSSSSTTSGPSPGGDRVASSLAQPVDLASGSIVNPPRSAPLVESSTTNVPIDIPTHVLLHPDTSVPSMPNLGHSPSTPNCNVFSSVVPNSSGAFASPDGGVCLPNGPSGMMVAHPVGFEERLTRLESTVLQLCQLCRALTLENQQLRISTIQLLLQQGRTAPSMDMGASDANAVASGLLSSASSVCPTPTGFSSAAPGFPSCHNAVFGNRDFVASNDNLQAILSQLLQQQMQCLQLQQQFQRSLQLSRADFKPQSSPAPSPFLPLTASQQFLPVTANALLHTQGMQSTASAIDTVPSYPATSINLALAAANLPTSFPSISVSNQLISPLISNPPGSNSTHSLYTDPYTSLLCSTAPNLPMNGVQPDDTALLRQMWISSNRTSNRGAL